MMSHSKEMFISDRKVLNAICTSSLQGLVQCELFSRFIHLVNHGACLVLVNISIEVPKSEEQTSINGKMLNSCSSSGWQVLNFLEEVETSGTFFDKSKTYGRQSLPLIRCFWLNAFLRWLRVISRFLITSLSLNFNLDSLLFFRKLA